MFIADTTATTEKKSDNESVNVNAERKEFVEEHSAQEQLLEAI